MEDLTINNYTFVISFYKVAEDNLTILKNEEYEIYSIDDQPTGIVLEKTNDGRHIFTDWTHNNLYREDVNKLFPNFLKDELSNIKTKSEFIDFYTRYNLNGYAGSNGGHVSINNPIVLKQITSENGYKKQDIIIKSNLEFYVDYNSSSGEITSASLGLYADDVENTSLLINNDYHVNTIDDFMNLNYRSLSDSYYSCQNSRAGLIITNMEQCTPLSLEWSDSYSYVPYFVSEQGTVKLEITNTVNGLTKYNASNNKQLEYKISVKNSGDVSSENNVLVTNVPKMVVVEESSISDSGVYNKQSNTISWNITKIDASEEVKVSYKAIAPKSADGKELIGNSYITSDQVTTRVYSNNTIVTLDKIVEIIDNPNTGMHMLYIPNTNIGIPISFLFIIIMIICISLVVFKNKFMKKSMLK